MISVGHTDDDMMGLISEMEIMKLIGKHKNIVNLLGCCTQRGIPLVIIEYACHGNLREFLKQRRPYPDFEQRELLPFNGTDIREITHRIQVVFSLDIAKGMEYLASRKVWLHVHKYT